MSCIVCEALYPRLAAARAGHPLVTHEGWTCHHYCKRDIDAALRVRTDATSTGNVVRWKANGTCVPCEIMLMATVIAVTTEQERVATKAKRREEQDAFLAEYRAAQSAQPSEEERANARAAHGPGVKLTNVLTGRTFTT